jgi:superfamily II DNA or RNA helicase
MNQQLLQIKDTEQRLALRAWKEKGFKGSVIAGTGFGKSRVGVMAVGEVLRRREGKGLLLVPTIQLQDQFADEFRKWGYEDILDRVDILCYASACKLSGETYTVTVADEVHLGLSPIYREVFYNNTHGMLLCMTATLPEEPEYRTILVNLAPPVYTITLDQCVAKGLVAPYKINCLSVELTEEERKDYVAANNMFVHYKYKLGQFDAFNEANRILGDKTASPEEKKNATMFYKAIRSRKEIVQKAYNKILYTAQIAKAFPDKKILTFGGSNEFTDAMHTSIASEGINAARYHSKMKKKERENALKDFKDNTIRVLCSTKALNQGFDVHDANLGIICGLDSKALQMIQRVGRLLRLSNADKVGEVIVLYVKNSQEEKWLQSAIKNLSNISWIDDISSYI